MFEQYWHRFENWYWALPQQTQFMLAAIFVFWLLFNIFYNEKAVSFGPTILTTLGIFATFLGIALGLSEFDANNVQASVPALLSGLKTAFWASVAGVGGALLLKFRHQFFDRTIIEGTGENGEVTGADLARLLSGIQTALVGNEETSLITQIKLLRSDTNDRLDALKAAQLQALQELSKMGSQALVEALRDVIKDFNAKITEQFGDNFKALNDSVGKLLVWQERYRIAVLYDDMRNDLYRSLLLEFKSDLDRWHADIDPDLTIRFREPEVLFDSGKSDLKPKFVEILNDFFPRYVKVLGLTKYKDSIEEVRIEGHTSSYWLGLNSDQAYFKNMELSQARTRSTLEYVLTNTRVFGFERWIKSSATYAACKRVHPRHFFRTVS
jgi:outer membrane protein OmpA-like peptidoglycan-associated protein